MSTSVDTQIGGLHHAQALAADRLESQIEVMDPSAVPLSSDSMFAPQKAGAGATSPVGATVSEVLNDPASMAHSFMQKAEACRDRGDLQGYFAYHDHAMTWAQTEALARAT